MANGRFSITKTMALFTCVLLLGLHHLAQGRTCNALIEESSDKLLRQDLELYRSFQFSLPKLPKCELTTVDISFSLKYFYIDSDKGTLTMHTWMYLAWKDERLTWDPDKYNGIKDLEVKTRYIWMPIFKLKNAVDSFDFDYMMYLARCVLKNNGDVVCLLNLPFEAPCSMKLSNFPYEIQECELKFGSVNNFNVNTSSNRVMGMLAAAYGSQWTITDYKHQYGQVTGKELNITLTFEREGAGFAAVVVYPSLILSSLTIASLFLDVRLNVRLMFACFSLGSHYFWLTELGENLPKGSLDPPNILMYYRGSMILTVFVLCITFALIIICRKQTTPHRMIVFINKFVYGSYVQYLVFPRWDVIDGDKFNDDWIKFANGVNSLCTIVVIISYVSLYFRFMPQPPPVTY